MTPDPGRLRQMAEARLEENLEFRQFFKGHAILSSDQIDTKKTHKLEARVWNESISISSHE